MAITVETDMEIAASAMVIGISPQAAAIAERCCQIESPKSPWIARP